MTFSIVSSCQASIYDSHCALLKTKPKSISSGLNPGCFPKGALAHDKPLFYFPAFLSAP
jgi:hypothetical protein